VFEGLVESASERKVDRRLHGLRQVLTVVDGTILPALPRMAWVSPVTQNRPGGVS